MTRPPQKIRLRRATALDWSVANSILEDGELGLEKDTRKIKAGDGVGTADDVRIAVAPAKPHQVIDHRAGQKAHIAIGLDSKRPVPL